MAKPSTPMTLGMDLTQQRLFVTFFKSLPEKPPTTIRFFNRTEYYSVHGTDTILASNEIFRTTSFIKTIGSGKETLDSLILNKSQFETLVRDLLLVKQYRVEVYISKGGKSTTNWTLEYKGSPGNLSQFEEILFTNIDQVEGTSVISVKFGGEAKSRIIGISLIDMVEHKFSVCEFPDDDYFTNLEGLIVQFGPKECLIPGDNSPEIANLKKVCERCGLLVTSRKKNDFSTDGLIQDLNTLIRFKEGQQQNANTLPQMELSCGMGALSAGIKYLELTSDNENFGQFNIETLSQGRFVHLDSAAISALSIVPTLGTTHNSHTVVGLLDKCRTSHGHRLLCQWVRQPLKDMNVITERHDIVEILTQETVLRQALYEEHLRKIPDLQALSKRLQRKKSNLQDCYRIYQGIDRLPSLIKCLEEYNSEPHPTICAVLIDPFKEHLRDMEKFQEMVVSTLDLSLVDKGEYLVKPCFDEDLQNLREKMDSLEESLKRELNKAARDLSLEPNKTLKLETNSQYGYFFRVTLKDEKVIRNNKQYTMLDANKGGVRFRNDKLSRINDEYIEVREDYTKHQQSVVSEIVSIAVGYCDTIYQISSLLAQLDVLCSFAVVAVSAPKPFVRPVMKPMGSGVLQLTQARHPCLELVDSVSFIPNDVSFSADECTFNIITGPNMGGKSTYIRSAGVIVLLAHIGSLVPCDYAEISVVDAILARVGANDSQIKGMSTFMVEMVETASILKTATANSLVIIDELGRGTSTYEGCGIAWAIAEYLAKEVKAFCLFATHFHELTRLSEEISTLHNLHVSAATSDDALTLFYQVKKGACDQSFGIHVANMAKFPASVIEDAKLKLAELEDYQSSLTEENDSRKRKIIQEGEELISEVLMKCKKFKCLSDQEMKIEISKLKDYVLSQKNPYLDLLVKTVSPTIV